MALHVPIAGQSTAGPPGLLVAGVVGGFGMYWKVALGRRVTAQEGKAQGRNSYRPTTPGGSHFEIEESATFPHFARRPAHTLGAIHAFLHERRQRIAAVGIASPERTWQDTVCAPTPGNPPSFTALCSTRC